LQPFREEDEPFFFGRTILAETLTAALLHHPFVAVAALCDRNLAERLQHGIVAIGPMARDELSDVILQPAMKIGLSFEAGLPERILDDVGDEPGGLPLLEFMLEALWTERRGGIVTHEAYARLGSVSGALAHRAENVFESLNEAERQAAKRLLIRMVRPGEGVAVTRRPTTLPLDDPIAANTVLKLEQERLVVIDCLDTG
jgi:hypothetical protein